MTDPQRLGWTLLFALLLAKTPTGAAEWHVDGKADNTVTFTSEVVTFNFEGTTQKVDGYLYWEGPGLFEGKPQLFFQVEVNGFDTGIGKRDSDMRDVLETKSFPYASYKASILSHTAVEDSSGNLIGHRVQTRGSLSLHGVERTVDIPGLVVLADSSATVSARFDLRLADYDIEAPSLAAFVKVSERIDIDVDLSLRRVK